jgi:hypothetical protein
VNMVVNLRVSHTVTRLATVSSMKSLQISRCFCVFIEQTRFEIMLQMSVCGSAALVDLGRFCSFIILSSVSMTLWTGSACRKAATYTQNTNTDVHDWIEIRNHNPSLPASLDSSCLIQGGHFDRHLRCITVVM